MPALNQLTAHEFTMELHKLVENESAFTSGQKKRRIQTLIDSDVWFNKGLKSLNTDKSVLTALDCFKMCYTIEETHVASIFNLAVCYDLLGKFKCAIKYFDMCIHLKPQMSIAYFGSAYCNVKIGNHDASLSQICSVTAVLED